VLNDLSLAAAVFVQYADLLSTAVWICQPSVLISAMKFLT